MEDAKDKLGKTLAELVQVAAIAMGKYLADSIVESMATAKEVEKERKEEEVKKDLENEV